MSLWIDPQKLLMAAVRYSLQHPFFFIRDYVRYVFHRFPNQIKNAVLLKRSISLQYMNGDAWKYHVLDTICIVAVCLRT